MKARDKKLAILLALSRERAPVGLSYLLKHLTEEFAERTVRRLLTDLVAEHLVEKSGTGKSTQYRAIKVPHGKQTQLSSCFGSESAKVIEAVRKPIYERTPTTYHEKWLDSYEPNQTFYFPKHIRELLYKEGKRANHHEAAGTYAHQIYNRLLIDLSYNSSRLEGNTYSLLDTERLILQGISAEGKLDEEKVMILNHKEAIRYLVDQAPKIEMIVETICTLHYLLSEGLLDPKECGKIRNHGVRIGGTTYLPLSHHDQLKALLDKIVKKAGKIQDPYEQSLFLLVHLSYLQAFADVNKRTSRLSANISLITNNLVPLSFNEMDQADYISALIAVYELQDVRPMSDIYVYSYLRSCISYDSTVKDVKVDEIRVRTRAQRRALIRKIIESQSVGSEMHALAKAAAQKIPPEERAAFLEDLYEDLDQMDLSRIVGLGVTSEELELWLKSYREAKET